MKISINKLMIVSLLLFTAILTGCSGSGINLMDGDIHISKEMNEVISNYIIQHYGSSYYDTEKQIEVHKIYGTSESNGVLSVYMWSYFCGFNKSTGTEPQAGHSLPAVIQLKKDGDSYSVVKYKEPEDGSLYPSSLKKMFPKRYLKLVHRDTGNIGDLEKEMDKKVESWLKE